jgi:hypothetical protein
MIRQILYVLTSSQVAGIFITDRVLHSRLFAILLNASEIVYVVTNRMSGPNSCTDREKSHAKTDATRLYHSYGYGCPPDAYCSTRRIVAVLCAMAHIHHLNIGILAKQARQGRKRRAYAPFFVSCPSYSINIDVGGDFH